jgi:serine phosphatase RsbU (regulator of sigma subunit)/anti-sigma regulatory factor (Ser/Thr protein kinase)
VTQVITRRRGASGAPRLLDENLLGIAPMAVILLNDAGRVTHWNSVATEIFGLAHDRAVGRPLRTLLRLPQEHRDAFDPAGPRIRHVWTGVFLVPRVEDDQLREVAWWVYPLAGPDRVRVLAVAADVQRLRERGPGLALGEVLISAPSDVALTGDTGVRVLRVEPTLLPTSGADTDMLGRRLTEMLPAMRPGAAEPIVRQILNRGYPAVNVSVTARLPFAAYPGSPPAPRTRIGPAEMPRHERMPSSLERSAAKERLDFLSEAGAQIVDTLDPVQTAAALCDALVPRLADFADVQLLESIVSEQELPPLTPDESPTAVRVAVSHDDAAGSWDDVARRGETLRLPPSTPFTQSLLTGRSVAVTRVNERFARRMSARFGDRDLRPLLQGRALLVAPLIARGTALGNLTLLRRADRPSFDELDVTMVEELCRRAAVCVDNGRLYRREARVAAELQTTMLPDAPPVVAGAEICYRYVPANEAVRVGGDWFDAIPLPGGRLALVVGDVMGHGLTSAAIMGQLRTAVRTLAAQDLPPGRLLRQLDDLARRLGDEYLATCIYVVYDPVARRCQVANAGHLPPVLVSPFGDSELLEVPSGVPIGVGGVAFETAEFEVEDDSQFVLCTDGLVERRGQAIDVGLAALREYLSGPPQPLESVCETLIEGFGATGRRDDDIALLAVRFEGIPKDDVISWTLDAAPARVRHARELARHTLATWGLTEHTEVVELLVSELVTNAVCHGAGDIGLRLIRAGSLLCEVRDDGHELPILRRADVTAENGRGLQLVTALAERWGTQRTPTGKVVWFEQPL